MDLSAITAVSHVLNIKEKLFPQKREESIEKEIQKDESIYCFLFLEYSCSEMSDKDSLELIITKQSEFMVPIRHIDWLFQENQSESIKPIDFDIPSLLQIGNEGLIIEIDSKSVLSGQIRYRELKGHALKNSLKSLCLQCTYANGYKRHLPAPDLLKQKIYDFYS